MPEAEQPPRRRGMDPPGRAATVERLVRAGVPRSRATSLLDIWAGRLLDPTELDMDPVFWTQGYAFALRQWQASSDPTRLGPSADEAR